MHTCP